MNNIVKNFIIENNLAGKTILIGLSGGIDSSVLCDILSKIKEIKLIAIHLNHNWRGAQSKADENFAKNFAKKRKIEFYSETLPLNTPKNETIARELRYKFFENCKEKFNANAVFLAHNKNDNTETLIYRIIKGTGPLGLCSIPKVRDFYFRPLLGVERGEIEEYAQKNGVDFVVDKSNFDVKYKRNLIREKILPEMKKINKEVVNSISTLIKLSNENQKIVDFAINEAISKIKTEKGFLRDKFLNLPVEFQFEIINRKLKGILKTRDYSSIKRVVNFIKENNSSKISIKDGLFLKVYNNEIYLIKNEEEKNEPETPLKEGKNYFLNYEITIEKSPAPKIFPKMENEVQFVNLNFKNPYKIRQKKSGDKILPYGSKNEQKLKTFFIKKKVPSELRKRLPVIALGDEVLFIPKILLSEKIKVKNLETCYKITVKEI